MTKATYHAAFTKDGRLAYNTKGDALIYKTQREAGHHHDTKPIRVEVVGDKVWLLNALDKRVTQIVGPRE